MKNGRISIISIIAVGATIIAIGILLIISGFGKPPAPPTSPTYFYEARNIPGTTTNP